MIELTAQEAALVADLMKIANYPLDKLEVAAGLKAKLAKIPQLVNHRGGQSGERSGIIRSE